MSEKKKWTLHFTPQFLRDFAKLSPEEQEETIKAIEGIQKKHEVEK